MSWKVEWIEENKYHCSDTKETRYFTLAAMLDEIKMMIDFNSELKVVRIEKVPD
ncbi:MAG TPA: hypothetical protein V6C86_24290 [Oculatellaceae cyanobacterium]